MSHHPTWVEGGCFYKRYESAELATTALERSRACRAGGLATPEARTTSMPDVLRFELISGKPVPQDDKAALISALRPVTGLKVGGLTQHDPFARIDARLWRTPEKLLRRIEALRAIPLPPGGGSVHGDFHPGQVMRDGFGKLWLIDLDDMATGPVEADIGNLAAYLATQPHAPPPQDAGPDETRWLCAAWRAAGGECDPDLAMHYTAIALIRRALKLVKRGRAEVLESLISAA